MSRGRRQQGARRAEEEAGRKVSGRVPRAIGSVTSETRTEKEKEIRRRLGKSVDICEHHRAPSALRRALVEADGARHRSPMAGAPICTRAARQRRAVGAGMAAARVTHGRRAPVWRAGRPPPGVWRPDHGVGHQRGAYHPRARRAGESISPTPHKASATLCGVLHPPPPVPKRSPAAATGAAGTLRSGAWECRPAHGRSGCHAQALPRPPPQPVPSYSSAAVAGAGAAGAAAAAAVASSSSDLLCVAAGGRLSVADAPHKCVAAAGGGEEQSQRRSGWERVGPSARPPPT